MLQPPATSGAFDAKTVLLGALAVIGVLYLVVVARGLKRAQEETGVSPAPTPAGLATGFFTNFWDTLGIGSFATTTAIFRQWKMVRDEQIPGTLNIGHTLPTIAQAFIYTTIVEVDALTLISLIAASVVGAWLGAGVVSGWSRRKVQIGMGIALLAAAVLLFMKITAIFPAGSDSLGLTGIRLAIGLVGNFILGALMTMGIGLYAPCIILVSLLGMKATTAFPIMMGSCAFLMPTASARFIREKAFDPKAIVGLAVGGIPAVLIAAFIVKTLPIKAVGWLVIVVVVYTGATMLRSAMTAKSEPATP